MIGMTEMVHSGARLRDALKGKVQPVDKASLSFFPSSWKALVKEIGCKMRPNPGTAAIYCFNLKYIVASRPNNSNISRN